MLQDSPVRRQNTISLFQNLSDIQDHTDSSSPCPRTPWPFRRRVARVEHTCASWNIPVDGQQVAVDAIAVVDVDVVPAALGGEVVHIQLDRAVVGAVDQPRALHVDRVVADPVRDDTLRLRQSVLRGIQWWSVTGCRWRYDGGGYMQGSGIQVIDLSLSQMLWARIL